MLFGGGGGGDDFGPVNDERQRVQPCGNISNPRLTYSYSRSIAINIECTRALGVGKLLGGNISGRNGNGNCMNVMISSVKPACLFNGRISRNCAQLFPDASVSGVAQAFLIARPNANGLRVGWIRLKTSCQLQRSMDERMDCPLTALRTANANYDGMRAGRTNRFPAASRPDRRNNEQPPTDVGKLSLDN